MESWNDKLNEVTATFKSISREHLKNGDHENILFIEFEQGKYSFGVFL